MAADSGNLFVPVFDISQGVSLKPGRVEKFEPVILFFFEFDERRFFVPGKRRREVTLDGFGILTIKLGQCHDIFKGH